MIPSILVFNSQVLKTNGIRDTISSGTQLSGLQFGNTEVKVDTSATSTDSEANTAVEGHVNNIVGEPEEQKRLCTLLAADVDSTPQIDAIPVPPSKADAL